MFPEAFEIPLDSILDVVQSLLSRFALRNTPRQYGTLGHKHTVFVLFNQNSIAPSIRILSLPVFDTQHAERI